jgi:hypothetical protein
MRNRIGALLISAGVLCAIQGCATTDVTTVQDEQDLRFTGVVTAGEVRGERSAQVLGVVESALLQKFPKAKWLAGGSSIADVVLDISVYSARITESRSTQETRTCRRWSEPDKNAKGTLQKLISRNCLDWQTQQNPCITRNYELDVQIRARQRATERILVSDRKVSAGSDRACGNERPTLAALQADAESKLARWAVNLMRDPFAALASSPIQSVPNLLANQHAGKQVTVGVSEERTSMPDAQANSSLTASSSQSPVIDLFKAESNTLSQSSLPACQGSDASRWTNCVGSVSYTSGNKYFGEYKDGKFNGKGSYIWVDGNKHVGEWRENLRNGQGIEYRANGTIISSGQWANGNLVQFFSVDINRFPFNQTAQTASVTQSPATDPLKAERDRLTAEVEAERRKRQEFESQLADQPKSLQALKLNAHALVIGNGAYPGSGRLDNPVNDANAISQKLRSMGFTVTTVTDANRQKLVQSMAQFRRSAASADLSLLFYAGHGVQIFGTNYILPTDVDQTDPAQATIQGVSLNSVVENFLPGKTKLVFLDACRDNPLQRTNDRSVSKGLAPISAAEGTLISYATKDGQTAADGAGTRNSPFTQALLEHLNDPQDIAVVLRKVREKVMKATGGKQQPWEYGSLTGGELVLSAIRPK